nr:mediator of rna polymerase ii transcription subunit 10 [Quercus suber]
MPSTSEPAINASLRACISNLYLLMVQTHDYNGAATSTAMRAEIKSLVTNLISLAKSAEDVTTHLPLDIIQYVERSRNPDIYTREFVELVMRYNQQMRGRSEAFAEFRDVLAREMMGGIPDMGEDVQQVLKMTGGQVEGLLQQ